MFLKIFLLLLIKSLWGKKRNTNLSACIAYFNIISFAFVALPTTVLDTQQQRYTTAGVCPRHTWRQPRQVQIKPKRPDWSRTAKTPKENCKTAKSPRTHLFSLCLPPPNTFAHALGPRVGFRGSLGHVSAHGCSFLMQLKPSSYIHFPHC